MNFASRQAYLSKVQDEEVEIAYESDLLGHLPPAAEPLPALSFSQHTPPLVPISPFIDSRDDLIPLVSYSCPERKSKDELREADSFVSALAGMSTQLLIEPMRIPIVADIRPCASLSSGARLSSSLQRKVLERDEPQQGVFKVAVDSNVVEVPWNMLKQRTTVISGQPERCESCEALIYSTTVLKQLREWTCEFCGRRNRLRSNLPSLPCEGKITYELEIQPIETGSIVFVLDISGSMEAYGCLENLKEAVKIQLHNIARKAPETPVGLITFSSSVQIIGDGRNSQTIRESQQLKSQRHLLKAVQGRFSFFLSSQIASTEHSLVYTIDHLKSEGGTALGPAIFLAVHLVKESGPGSRIILCTDGCANEGLGDLENGSTQNVEFYKDLSVEAREASVSISVFCLEGAQCRLDALLPLANNTGGQVK
jgi:hypothetical protein